MRCIVALLAIATVLTPLSADPTRTGEITGKVVSTKTDLLRVEVADCPAVWAEMMKNGKGKTILFRVPYVASSGKWKRDPSLRRTLKGLKKGSTVTIQFWAGSQKFWIESISGGEAGTSTGGGDAPTRMGKMPRKVVLSGPSPWAEVANGLTLTTPNFIIRGDISREELVQLASLTERMNLFHQVHFGSKLAKGWKVTLITKRSDFITYSKKIGSKQYGGGGYCEWNRKEFVGRGDSGHSWETLIKHELGHAYYRTRGPFWLREGAAVLVESLKWVGGKPRIEVNRPRLKQLKGYWRANKHTTLRCCTLRPVYPIAYAHHWSFHYYVWIKKGQKFYRQWLQTLKGSAQTDDLTDKVVKLLGAGSIDQLERDWKAFVTNLK